MARNKEFLEDDFDIDLDMDFDFPGDKPLPPPKNKREAVTRSLKDGFKGAKDELMQNPLKDINKVLDAGMPRSLRSEYQDLKGAAGDVKKAASDAIAEVKKSGQEFTRGIAKLTPEGSKFRKLLDKLGGTQGETLRGPSKEQVQTDEINGAILGALGAQQEQASVNEAIRNAMEEKRAATTANLLQSIYAEVRMERSFHYKITNSYYRKSLEIQMKQLYTQKELLELTRTNFANFKAQYEAIVLNTGLPDILKITKAEALGKDIGARARKQLIDSLYKNFNPMNAISQKMIAKITDVKNGFVNGFQMMSGGMDMAGGMDMSSMGMTKSGMAGMMAASYLKDMMFGKMGEKLAKTKIGKNAVFGAKNMMADPNAFINDMKNKKRSGKLGKAQDWFWNMMSDFTGAPGKNSYKFEKKDLNAAQIFDGRAHQAIVKVIPGLLSKIHAELKASRMGGDPRDYELAFDNKTESFTSQKKMAKNAIKDIKSNFAKSAGYYATSFTGLLQEYGGNLTPSDVSAINRALVAYLLKNNSSLSPGMIVSNQFLNHIQDPKIRSKAKKYGAKVLKAAKDNPSILDDITMFLQGIRRAMPSANGYMEDFHKSGNMKAAVKMGLAKKTKDGYVYNDQALNDILISTVLTDGGKEAQEQKSFIDSEVQKAKDKVKEVTGNIKAKATGFVGSIVNGAKDGYEKVNSIDKAKGVAMGAYEGAKGAASSGIAKAKQGFGYLKNLDKQSAVNYFNKKKLKANDLIDSHILSRMSPQQKAAVDSTIGKIRSYSTKLEKQIATVAKAAGDSAVAGDIREAKKRVDDKVAEFIQYAADNGYNKQAFDNYVNEVKIAASESKQIMQEKGISSVADVMLKVATGGTKEEWEQKTKEMYGKAAKGALKLGKDFMSERSIADLKDEYFKSKESKGPNAPTFQEWVDKMGYKVKGSTLKKIRTATLAMDRKMAKFLLKLPFRVAKFGAKGAMKIPGLAWKGAKAALGLGGSIAGGAGSNAAKLVKEMFTEANKNGGEAATSQAAQMTSVTTSLMTADSIKQMADTLRAKESGENNKKERKGSWMSRLSLFGSKGGKDNTEKNVKEGEKKGPLWMILGLLGGVFGFVKKMFGGIGSIVKWVTKGFKFLFKLPGMLISGIGGAIKGLGSMLSSAGGAVAGAAKGAWDWVKDKAGKLKDGAKNLVSKGVDAVKSTASKVSDWALRTIKAVIPDKIYSAAEKAFNKIKSFGSKFKKFFSALGRMAKKFGGKIAVAIGKFIAKYVVSSGTGIGVLLAAGFAAWDVGWILKYWIGDGLTLGNAICKQLLGFTPFGEGQDAEPDPFNDDAQEDAEGEDQKVQKTASENAQAEANRTGENGAIARAGQAGLDAAAEAKANGSGFFGQTFAAMKASTVNLFTGGGGAAPVAPGAGLKNPPAEYGKRPALTKIDNPSLNDSPYIKTNGKTANVKDLNPTFKQKVLGFAEDYYQWTGKQLVVNSGTRKLEDQIRMWEEEAKTKYTGDRKKDEAATAKAGGKFYNFRGGRVAYPNKNPKPGHLTGEAVDLNIGSMPGGDKINHDTRTPWLDDMLAKWGLRRPLTRFNGYKGGSPERWHIDAVPGKWSPPETQESKDEPQIVDPNSMTGKDKAQIKDEEKKSESASETTTAAVESASAAVGGAGSTSIAGIGANSNYGGGGPSEISGGSPVNTSAAAAASSATAAMSSPSGSAAAASNSTMSVGSPDTASGGGGSFTELLAKQLEVQTKSMEYLRIISENIGGISSGGGEASSSGSSDFEGAAPGSTDFPAQAVSLKRKENYA